MTNVDPAAGAALAVETSDVAPVEHRVTQRREYVDNLKVLLIVALIVGHGLLGYSALEFWPYSEMNEVELSPAIQAVLITPPYVLIDPPETLCVSCPVNPKRVLDHRVRALS